MKKETVLKFNNPTKGELTVGEMIADISNFVDRSPHSQFKLVIGTDSQVKQVDGVNRTDFVTVIVIHGDGIGGRIYWRKKAEPRAVKLREKIHTETWLSLMYAQEIVPAIRSKISPTRYDFEIHIDVGALGQTRDMITEVVGMVTANGFSAKTKPESWGASSVADRFT